MTDVLLGALIAGVSGLLAALTAGYYSHRSESKRWRRDRRLEVYTQVLAAFDSARVTGIMLQEKAEFRMKQAEQRARTGLFKREDLNQHVDALVAANADERNQQIDSRFREVTAANAAVYLVGPREVADTGGRLMKAAIAALRPLEDEVLRSTAERVADAQKDAFINAACKVLGTDRL